ncbi:hypothetical protein IPV09_13895, partial [Tessaracoccus sp. SD287]|uniref:hypothetical protein n=1 Tax=Tessaracoccus sp. SD287 TaxID=2782008 RepID=UPI001A9619EE
GEMNQISTTAGGLSATQGTFGFVTPPTGAYNRFQSNLQGWSTGAHQEFTTIGENLNADAQGYRDLASEQAQEAGGII